MVNLHIFWKGFLQSKKKKKKDKLQLISLGIYFWHSFSSGQRIFLYREGNYISISFNSIQVLWEPINVPINQIIPNIFSTVH